MATALATVTAKATGMNLADICRFVRHAAITTDTHITSYTYACDSDCILGASFPSVLVCTAQAYGRDDCKQITVRINNDFSGAPALV